MLTGTTIAADGGRSSYLRFAVDDWRRGGAWPLAGSCQNGRRLLRFSWRYRVYHLAIALLWDCTSPGESDQSPAIPPPGRGSHMA